MSFLSLHGRAFTILLWSLYRARRTNTQTRARHTQVMSTLPPAERIGLKNQCTATDTFKLLTLLLCSNFSHIYYAWGQFDPSNLNLQKIIIIFFFTHVFVSGTLGLFVDYLNSPLNKTIPPPTPLIHPEYMLRDYGEICRSP